MIDFLSLKTKAFGLDFSNLSLRFVNLKKKGRFLDLASWKEMIVRPGIIEQGEIKDVKSLSNIIKQGLAGIKGEPLKTKNVIASLPEQKAFLEVIKMPKMEEEELKTAVFFEAENHIPLSVEEVYLDFQVIPSVEGFMAEYVNILLVAVPKKIVDPYVVCLKEAGLSPRALEIESMSISRALIKDEYFPQSAILIDFGKSTTGFAVFSGHSLRFTSSIPISSDKLTEAISQSLGVDLEQAEKLKIRYGLSEALSGQPARKNRVLRKNISKAITPVLEDLTEEIKRYLNYYQTHAKNGYILSDGQRITKIILCGRGANLKGLPDFFHSQLGISTELGNPWVNILHPSLRAIPKLSFKNSLGYTTALGLALRGTKG